MSQAKEKVAKKKQTYTQKPKQSVNQFLHCKKSTSFPEKDFDNNSQFDVEILSPAYPKEQDKIIVCENEEKKSVNVPLFIINHLSDLIVLDRIIIKEKNILVNSITIESSQRIHHTVNVEFQGLSHVYTYVEFGFHDEKTGTPFVKKAVISAQLRTSDLEVLKATSPYKHLPAALLQKGDASTIVYKAPFLDIRPNNKLPRIKVNKYLIPDIVRKLINHGLKDDGQLTKNEVSKLNEVRTLLQSKLSKNNYKEYFRMLLYIEEMQNEIEIIKYTIPKTPMYYQSKDKNGIYLELEVAGIIDSNIRIYENGNLSVRIIQGDGKLSKEMYMGNIMLVKKSSIVIIFGRELASLYYDDMQFEVRLIPSRHVVKLQQRALDLVEKYKLWPVLFPVSVDAGQLGRNPIKIDRFFDENISQNPEQQIAINNIVSGVSRPCPYIIYGPPGTGKTVTMTEAIKQVVTLLPNSRILACAVSNSATDILALKLVEFEPKIKILRMYALYFEPNKIPEKIFFSSNFSGEDNNYFYPSPEELATYDVIICTVTTAGRLTSECLLGHFTHIFIDEAGFCMESELIVAIAGNLDLAKTQLVLAGDPKQLGPVIRSPFAKEYKLNISLLERIMSNFQLYKRESDQEFNQEVITKLIKNYRSHPDILKVVSDLFYDSELKACADIAKVTKFCKWNVLPKTGFPLLIHSVVGKEQREGNSPSYFNPEEACVVLRYIEKLYEYGTSPQDIGVITPYCKQVQKINILLQKHKMKRVKVDSVEKFLGDERMVIIISTVRSNPDNAADDYKKCMLGFIKNEKRLNVAISRPKALLIIIGNIHCLRTDALWNRLITYCTDNKAIKAENVTEAMKYI